MSNFFKGLNEEQLLKRIREFRRLNHRNLSDVELMQKLNDLFVGSQMGFSFPAYGVSYPKKTNFFRVRSIPNNESAFPIQSMKSVEDAWEPPSHLVKYGRTNRPKKPVLYCCVGNPILAFQEARIEQDKFSLIVYESKKNVTCAAIGADYPPERFSVEDGALLRHFYDFMEVEFTREVGLGNEHQYRTSTFIAESFFTYPEQHAWSYRSAIDRTKFNCAFLPGQAKGCLDLVGVMICESAAAKIGSICAKCVVDFSETDYSARYHAIGSDRQRVLFPEITVSP